MSQCNTNIVKDSFFGRLGPGMCIMWAIWVWKACTRYQKYRRLFYCDSYSQ